MPDPTVRELQLAELEILRWFADLCAGEGLRWFVIGGTLLGAARHRAFIPWDDDIDVGMPRPDYERFARLVRRAADPGFQWLSPATQSTHPYMYGKLVAVGADAGLAEPGRREAFIDVFPIDGAPAGPFVRRLHGLAFKVAVTALGARLRRRGVRRSLAAPLRLIPRRVVLSAIDWLVGRYPFDSSAYAVNASGAWGYRRECQPRSRFVPTTTLAFEGMQVPAPGRWPEYLGQVYGHFLTEPPADQRRPRHEPTARVPPGHAVASEAARPAPGGLTSALVATMGRLVVEAGYMLGRVRSPRPYVVLASREAAAIDGNLEWIRREMDRRQPRIPVRIVGYKTRAGLRGTAVSAWEAFRASYHLAAARLFVADNWFFPADVARPRRGLLRVQVWHAAGAFKAFGYSVLQRPSGPREDLIGLIPERSGYDLCLASSEAVVGPYMEAFRLPRERITSAIGVPRTDAFFDVASCARAAEAVRRRYGLPHDRRVLLYAPTYRGERVRDARTPDMLDLGTMHAALDGTWLVLVRAHPLVRRSTTLAPELAGFVVDVSDWPDINELMVVADILVTDYSSAIFEFALLRRPMAFLAPDLEAYERERGFYLDVPDDLPGPLFETTAELAAFLREGSFDLDRVTAFARRWFDVADGHASERFVDKVVLPALRGDPVVVEPRPKPADRIVGDAPCAALGR